MSTTSQASGLDALIPKGDRATSGYREIPVAKITVNKSQPRETFDLDELDSLVASVKLVGILQPIAVRPARGDTFELISGERRWRASQRAGLEFIPAVIRQIDDEASLQHAVMENVHRVDLNPLEEAAAYQHLIDEYKLTQDEVAKRVGKSRAAVTNLVRLMKLPAEIQKHIVSGEITAGHARSLVSVTGKQEQLKLARRIIKENLSVRQVEEYRKAQSGKKKKGKSGAVKGGAETIADRKIVVELEEFLAEKLKTRVSISLGSKGVAGKAVIEFADLEDLERIVSELVK